jgi:hypothetical protein
MLAGAGVHYQASSLNGEHYHGHQAVQFHEANSLTRRSRDTVGLLFRDSPCWANQGDGFSATRGYSPRVVSQGAVCFEAYIIFSADLSRITPLEESRNEY